MLALRTGLPVLATGLLAAGLLMPAPPATARPPIAAVAVDDDLEDYYEDLAEAREDYLEDLQDRREDYYEALAHSRRHRAFRPPFAASPYGLGVPGPLYGGYPPYGYGTGIPYGPPLGGYDPPVAPYGYGYGGYGYGVPPYYGYGPHGGISIPFGGLGGISIRW